MLFEIFPHLLIGPILATLSWVLLIGVVAWCLVFKTRLFNRFVDVPFKSAICTILNIIFIFFMAFMGSEFHEVHKSASFHMVKERAAINRLLHADFPTEALNRKVELSVQKYLKNVIDVEWRENLNGQESVAVQEAILELSQIVPEARKECASSLLVPCIDSLTAANYFQSIDSLREARDFRLSIGTYERERLRYVLCVLLALNAAVAVLTLYRNDKRAAVVPFVMYGVSVWITFLIVVLQAKPYVGVRAIEPTILEHVLRQIQ
jgi:hypothetical protein